MQKENQAEDNCEKSGHADSSENSEDTAKSYYYDDAHGYEEYDPEEGENEED